MSHTSVWPAELEMAYLPITSSLFYKALKNKTNNFIFRYNKKLISYAAVKKKDLLSYATA